MSWGMNYIGFFCLSQITKYLNGLKFWGYVGHTFKKNENNNSKFTVDIKAVSSSNKHETLMMIMMMIIIITHSLICV